MLDRQQELAWWPVATDKNDLNCSKSVMISMILGEFHWWPYAAAAEKISTFLGLATSPRHNEKTTVQPPMMQSRVESFCTLLRRRIDKSGSIEERLTTIIDVQRDMFF